MSDRKLFTPSIRKPSINWIKAQRVRFDSPTPAPGLQGLLWVWFQAQHGPEGRCHQGSHPFPQVPLDSVLFYLLPLTSSWLLLVVATSASTV